MNEQKYKVLSKSCEYSQSRISADKVLSSNYISTDNMIPNRGGVTSAESVPDTKAFSAYVPGNILLSNIRPYFKKIWFADKKGGCSNDVLVLKAKKDTDARFLYYVLSDNNFFNYSTVTSKGTKMPRGSKHAIMKYLVPDVGLPTQKRIADILSAYDDLIENNNKRIALLEKAAQELYKEWFVRFRFPGHETAEFENGLPKGWGYSKIKDVCSSIDYGYTESATDEDTGVKFLRITDIVPDKLIWNNVPYCPISEEDFKKYKLLDGDIVIARTGATVGYAKCIISPPDAVFASYLIRIRVNEKCNNRFLRYVIESDYYKRFVSAANSGGAQPNANANTLTRYKFILPTRKIQVHFVEVVSGILEEQNNLLQKNINLAKQRDLLLPRLMSGKLEV